MTFMILNHFAMLCRQKVMSESSRDVLDILNYFFAVIFTLEAILKLSTYADAYFADAWNCFDLFIVIGTDVSMFAQILAPGDAGAVAKLAPS